MTNFFNTLQTSYGCQSWAFKASLIVITDNADRRVAVAEERGVLAHPSEPSHNLSQYFDRRAAALTKVQPLHRFTRPLVLQIVMAKLDGCKLKSFFHLSNRTTLLPVKDLIAPVTVRPAHRGIEMQALVSAGPDITAMGDRPVMRYTPAFIGTRLIGVGQPLVRLKRPPGHHPEGATQARGGFTQKPQITNSCQSQRVKKLSTIRSPIKVKLVEINHRSRIAVPAARKEVVKQFYPGDLITKFFGNSSQIPKALSMVDSLSGDLIEAWQSTPFNAASTAKGACHCNGLARESAAFIRAIRQLKVN